VAARLGFIAQAETVPSRLITLGGSNPTTATFLDSSYQTSKGRDVKSARVSRPRSFGPLISGGIMTFDSDEAGPSLVELVIMILLGMQLPEQDTDGTGDAQ